MEIFRKLGVLVVSVRLREKICYCEESFRARLGLFTVPVHIYVGSELHTRWRDMEFKFPARVVVGERSLLTG